MNLTATTRAPSRRNPLPNLPRPARPSALCPWILACRSRLPPRSLLRFARCPPDTRNSVGASACGTMPFSPAVLGSRIGRCFASRGVHRTPATRSLLLRFAQRSPPATRNLPAGGEGKGYFSLLQYILERFFKLIYDNKSTNKKAKLHAFPAGGLRVASGNLCGIAAKATTELRVSGGHLAKRSNDRGCGSPVATFAAGKSNDRGGSRDLDSRRELRALVGRGHDSPPDCRSVPRLLQVPLHVAA